MGRRGEQWSLFYQFRLDERVPKDHLLRRIDGFVTTALADIHERLESPTIASLSAAARVNVDTQRGLVMVPNLQYRCRLSKLPGWQVHLQCVQPFEARKSAESLNPPGRST